MSCAGNSGLGGRTFERQRRGSYPDLHARARHQGRGALRGEAAQAAPRARHQPEVEESFLGREALVWHQQAQRGNRRQRWQQRCLQQRGARTSGFIIIEFQHGFISFYYLKSVLWIRI